MEEICRTCLKQQDNLFHLYSNPSLIFKIESIASIELSNDSFYPSKVCGECIENINNYFKFKKTIVNNCKELYKRYEDFHKHKEISIQLEIENTIKNETDLIEIEPEQIQIQCENEDNTNEKNTCEIETSKKQGTRRIIRMYDCRECGQQYTSRLKYFSHKKTHVTKGMCNICGLTIRIDNLSKHIQRHSADPVTCPLCGKIFKNTESLRSHKRIHMGFQFTCEICGKLFKVKTEYRRHLKLHSDPEIRKKACEICHKKVRDLRHHMISHTGERPYKCEYCTKGFTSSYALKVHVRQHTNEKPYMCELCPLAFPQKVSLVTHLKSRHQTVI